MSDNDLIWVAGVTVTDSDVAHLICLVDCISDEAFDKITSMLDDISKARYNVVRSKCKVVVKEAKLRELYDV